MLPHAPPSEPCPPTAPGRVFLVGAGPGEPGAITLRALECLAAADAVLYDYLVNPSILRWANRPHVQLISLGRHGSDAESDANSSSPAASRTRAETPAIDQVFFQPTSGSEQPSSQQSAAKPLVQRTVSAINRRIMPQSDVSALMVQLARAGQNVVRLKAGDPLIFARAAEEIAALQEAAIPFEVVPGITSALAAGSYAGIPLTHRDHASAVALVTGHPADLGPAAPGDIVAPEGHAPYGASNEVSNRSQSPPRLDWQALARFPGTLVVYMGTTQVEFWAAELLKYGKDPATPVAILRRCGFSDQTVKRTTLGQLIETATQPKRIRPPVVFLIGSAVDAPSTSAWFAQRPLIHQTVLITRPDDPQHTLARQFELLGAQVRQWPAIRILPATDPQPLDQAISELSQFDWIVFNSPNGVRHFMERLWQSGRDARVLHACRLAAIGRQTAAELERYHLRCDLVPDTFDADHLAQTLVDQAFSSPAAHPRRPTCLIIRASRGREVVAEKLSAVGVAVRQVVAYQNVDNDAPPPDLLEAMQSGKIDWVTVTSSAIADNLFRHFGDALQQTQIASISPITTGRLQQHGLHATVEAQVYTAQGIVDAIIAHMSHST